MTQRGDGVWISSNAETISEAFGRALQQHSDAVVLDFGGETYTYASIEQQTADLARGLATLGVKAGQTVLSMLDNSVDAAVVWLAVNRLGAIWVPVNCAYKREFLQHVVTDSTARVAIAEPDYAQRILDIEDGVDSIETILVRGNTADLDAKRTRVATLEQYRVPGGDFPVPASRPGDVCSLIYTGGTTGPSKGCMISHNYMMHTARQALWLSDRVQDEVVFNPLPMFHLNSLSSIMSSVLIGGTAAIGYRFSLSGFWPEIERTDAKVVNILGAMVHLIAQMDDTPEMERCRGQIRVVIGVPFTPDTERIWRERFGVARVGTPGYGLTEGSALTAAKIGEGKPGTSGKKYDAFDVRIFDDEDREVPTGQVGEIVFRPSKPNVMFEGYWRRPEATLDCMRNLWFHTGDLGKFDVDGWLTFVDRKKDYLRRRGENVSSFEVEATVLQHPDIIDVAVHAVPSDISEDDLKVTAVRAEGSGLREADFARWLIDRVPYFAVPRYIEFRSDLPRNPVGRVLKYQLRDEGCTPTTWDIETSDIKYDKR